MTSSPNHTGARRTKPLGVNYSLPGCESFPLKVNNSVPSHMYRSNGRIPEWGVSCLRNSKRKIVCVETPHWGYNVTTSTDGGKTKQGPHHQQHGASGIHCASQHFMNFNGYSATYCDQGGQHRHISMVTTRQCDICHRSRPAIKGCGLDKVADTYLFICVLNRRGG